MSSQYGEKVRLIRDDVTPERDSSPDPATPTAQYASYTGESRGNVQGKTELPYPPPNLSSSDSDSPGRSGGKQPATLFVLYRRRWLMLTLFCCYSASNAFQWNSYAIIQDVIINYYKPCLPDSEYGQALVVSWLALLYFVGYALLIIPATWLLNRYGLRVTAILGAGLNALGAAVKCASVGRDLMAVVYVGQITSSVAQVFLLGLPAHIAGAWFGENEVSTATAIGVFGNQVGIALGFLIPPVVVPQVQDMNAVANGYAALNYGTAAFALAVFILVLLVFREKPPSPPSRAQALATSSHATNSYMQSMKTLFTNIYFVLLTLAYGTLTAVFYGLSILLSPILAAYIEGADKLAGRLGLTMVLSGIVGSILAGLWLDRTKTYRFTTLVFNVMSIVGMFAFTFTLQYRQSWVMYVTIGILGFFMTGYLPIGFEFAAEITYPEPEGISSGMLNMSAQFLGILTTLGMQYLISAASAFAANIAFCVTTVIAFLFAVFVKSDLRRLRASMSFPSDAVNSSSSSNEDAR